MTRAADVHRGVGESLAREAQLYIARHRQPSAAEVDAAIQQMDDTDWYWAPKQGVLIVSDQIEGWRLREALADGFATALLGVDADWADTDDEDDDEGLVAA